MFKIVFSCVIFLSIAFSSFSSQAQEPFAYKFCNDCSAAQMKNKARTSISNGKIHIIDINRVVVKQYFVLTESEGEFFISQASEIPTENIVKESLDDVVEYTTWLNNALSGNGIGELDYNAIKPYVSGYNINSAHQLTKNQNMKYALQKALQKYVDLSAPLKLVSVISDMGKNFASTITFSTLNPVNTIKFPDGTTYQFNQVSFVLDTATGKVLMEFKLINGSGTDGNNPIPEGNSYAGLQVIGSSEQIGRYISNAPANTTITGNISSGGDGFSGTVSMECDSDGKCTVTYTP